jgi:hypothetical protein
MMSTISLDRYNTFVDTLLSQPSKDLGVLIARLTELEQKH